MAFGSRWVISAAALSCALLTSSCGKDKFSSVDPSLTRCSAKVAQIAVYDGILQNLCGCAEADGTSVAAPTPLTCTVPAGTTVIFQFLGARLRHQIQSVGTPSFISSPVTDPFDDRTDLPYGLPFPTPGTYQFRDTFSPTQAGQIVVT